MLNLAVSLLRHLEYSGTGACCKICSGLDPQVWGASRPGRDERIGHASNCSLQFCLKQYEEIEELL